MGTTTVHHGIEESGAWTALPKNPNRGARWYDETNRRLLVWDEDIGLWLPSDGGAVFNTTPLLTADDFRESVINGSWDLNKGTDGQCVNFAAVSGSPGVVKGTTGDVGSGTAADAIEICGPLSYDIANGEVVVTGRVKLSAITTVALFVGLTDVLGSTTLEMPFTLSVVTFTSAATDAVGFLFDTAATTDTVRCVAVKNNVDATSVDSADALVADTYRTFKIRIGTNGTARYYIDGTLVATIASAVRSGVSLCPVIAACARTTSSRDVTIDLLGAYCR